MKIGLVADTHIPEACPHLPPEVFANLVGCDRILHAGDLHVISVIDELTEIAPTVASRGNGDGVGGDGRRPGVPVDARVFETVVIEAGGTSIGLTHDLEHLIGLPDGVVSEKLFATFGCRVDIAVCGHTHIPMLWGLIDGTAVVNPGSATMPFGYLGLLGTVGFIDLGLDHFTVAIKDLRSGGDQLSFSGPSVHPCAFGPRPEGGT
jgi:putative phosphoesterase